MIGPKLSKLVSDEHSIRAAKAYAQSLGAMGVDEPAQRLADEFEAAVEAMYLMAASDGEVAQEELMLLSASLQAILGADGTGDSAELALPLLKLNEKLDGFAQRLADEGISARLSSVAERIASEGGRALAFRLAAGVAFVDDFVASGEADAIEALTKALGLSAETSQQLMREVHTALD